MRKSAINNLHGFKESLASTYDMGMLSTINCWSQCHKAAQQSHATKKTIQAYKMHFDYIVNDPNNEITDHASNMYLAADSDAGYQNESGARSHVGAHIFLSEDLQN